MARNVLIVFYSECRALSVVNCTEANRQGGFMGMDSAREEKGITVSYWRDVASIKVWKENLAHLQAQKLAKEKWYKSYSVRIAKVEREYWE